MKYIIDQTAWQQIKHMHPHFWAWNRPTKIGTCHNCKYHDDCKMLIDCKMLMGEYYANEHFCACWKESE